MLLVRDVDRLIASMRRQNKLGELDLLELPVWAKQLEQEGAGRQLRALETIVRELKVHEKEISGGVVVKYLGAGRVGGWVGGLVGGAGCCWVVSEVQGADDDGWIMMIA
jgi:hypothetical protein